MSESQACGWYRVTLLPSTPGPRSVVLDLADLGQATFTVGHDDGPTAATKTLRLTRRVAEQLQATPRTWQVEPTRAPEGRAVFDRFPAAGLRRRAEPMKSSQPKTNPKRSKTSQPEESTDA